MAGQSEDPSGEGGPAAGADPQIAALPPGFTPPARTLETAGGSILVDAAGMALYVFDDDAPGLSNCLDRCAENWPPLTADATDVAGGAWGIIIRDDGVRQWTYRGRPLYTWTNDKKPGDTTGDNVNDTWHLARP
ncbi:MAG: hypothetical protein IRY94_02475 [Rhodospirillaceae bacterium]|nr:hypothetical protein [Rhodospirillaceae bacterium]